MYEGTKAKVKSFCFKLEIIEDYEPLGVFLVYQLVTVLGLFLELYSGGVWEHLARWDVAQRSAGSLWRLLPTGVKTDHWGISRWKLQLTAQVDSHIYEHYRVITVILLQ